MIQTLNIHLFFINSSFSTTGFIFVNFLLPSNSQLVTITYLYVYIIGSITLFSFWYFFDKSSAIPIYRWDKLNFSFEEDYQSRGSISALFLALGAFSPFTGFLVKYIFIYGWVSSINQYGLLLVLLLTSALNSIAYFYLFYIMVVYPSREVIRGFVVGTKTKLITTSFVTQNLKNCLSGIYFVNLLLLVFGPFFFVIELLFI